MHVEIGMKHKSFTFYKFSVTVTTTVPSTEKKQPTAAEVREFYEKNKNKLDALQRYEIAQTEGVR